MSKLTDFKLLSFDVYGTLIDRESGALEIIRPMLEKSGKTSLGTKQILQELYTLEAREEEAHPDWRYSEVVTAVFPKLCDKLGLQKPTEEECKAFGASVGSWPAFQDTVDALKRLSNVYKLVVLSNVDNDSFKRSNAYGLEGFKFDAIYTAENIGSYKPEHKNFEYMLSHVKEDFGIERNEVLQTAQSQYMDHHPAKEIGIKSCWIDRPGATMGHINDPVWNWKFDTLGEMADAVEKELAEQSK